MELLSLGVIDSQGVAKLMAERTHNVIVQRLLRLADPTGAPAYEVDEGEVYYLADKVPRKVRDSLSRESQNFYFVLACPHTNDEPVAVRLFNACCRDTATLVDYGILRGPVYMDLAILEPEVWAIAVYGDFPNSADVLNDETIRNCDIGIDSKATKVRKDEYLWRLNQVVDSRVVDSKSAKKLFDRLGGDDELRSRLQSGRCRSDIVESINQRAKVALRELSGL